MFQLRTELQEAKTLLQSLLDDSTVDFNELIALCSVGGMKSKLEQLQHKTHFITSRGLCCIQTTVEFLDKLKGVIEPESSQPSTKNHHHHHHHHQDHLDIPLLTPVKHPMELTQLEEEDDFLLQTLTSLDPSFQLKKTPRKTPRPLSVDKPHGTTIVPLNTSKSTPMTPLTGRVSKGPPISRGTSGWGRSTVVTSTPPPLSSPYKMSPRTACRSRSLPPEEGKVMKKEFQALHRRFPSILVSNFYPSLRIDEPVQGGLQDCKLDIVPDLYQDIFFKEEHYNFIVMDENKVDHYVISVLAIPNLGSSTPQHKSLKTTKKGSELFLLNVEEDEKFKPCVVRIEEALRNTVVSTPFYHLSNPVFPKELLKVEKNHPQHRKAMKIGVILSRKDQVEPYEMFQNGQNGDTCSEEFWNFVNLMGNKIQLPKWESYRGDMGQEGETYYTLWRNIETIYHVAPMLGPEEHRRLIGNDVAVIFFHEEGEFDPSQLDKLGTVPQIYAVVTPFLHQYRIATFSNVNIKPYGPSIPVESLSPEETKDLLLTKLYNGLMMTTYCPPLNRLFYVPRHGTLEDIISQFPEESKKEYRKFVTASRPDQFTVEEGWFKVKIDFKSNSEDLDRIRASFNSKICLIKIEPGSQCIVVLDGKSRENLYYWPLSSLVVFMSTGVKSLTLDFADRREISFYSPEERKKFNSVLSDMMVKRQSNEG